MTQRQVGVYGGIPVYIDESIKPGQALTVEVKEQVSGQSGSNNKYYLYMCREDWDKLPGHELAEAYYNFQESMRRFRTSLYKEMKPHLDKLRKVLKGLGFKWR